MLNLSAPGVQGLTDLILDFNGTLACDGQLIDGVADRLSILGEHLKIHVVTGNTFGGADEALTSLPVDVHLLAPSAQAQAKRDFALRLPTATLACIGNGHNDALMMRECALAIAVIGPEGAWPHTVNAAHVVTMRITDALDLLLRPLRLTATLRP